MSWQPHFHLHGKNEGSLMNLVYIMSIKPFLMRHNPCSRAGDVRGMSWWVSSVMPLWYNQGYISFTPWPGWSHWRSSKVGGVLSGRDWQDYQWGSREYQTMCNLESIQSMQQWSGGVKHYHHHHTTPLITTHCVVGSLAKFWVNGPCFLQNLQNFLNFYDFISLKISNTIFKS